MVWDLLVQSLWNTNENSKKQNEASVGLPQGTEFLTYRNNKIQTLQKRTSMISAPNGYVENEVFQSSRKKPILSNNVEGFTGMIGPTSANKRNEQELAEVQAVEDTFNQKMSNYATAHRTLMDTTHSFITSTDSANKYANKNVRLANGEIGYVNSRGTYKWYPSKYVFESTSGRNGCPSSFISVDNNSNNYNMPGAIINTTPPLNVGTFMTAGQNCGREGRNINVMMSAKQSDIVPKWEGCYTINTGDKMEVQSDLGEKVSAATCKTRAADLGYSVFSLRDDGTGCSRCYVGNDINAAKTGGNATKEVTSYSFVHSPDALMSGLLRNGQIGVGKDMKGTSDIKTQFDAVVGCLPYTGADINKNTLVGSYGANCKAQVSSKCPPGYSGPNAYNLCTAGWTQDCGEECAKSKCSAVGGTFIPLDYRYNPYSCQLLEPGAMVKIKIASVVSWDDAKKIADANNGRLPTKDEFIASKNNVGPIDFWMPGTNGDRPNEWIHLGTTGWPLYYSHQENVGYPPPWGQTNTQYTFRPSPTTIDYIFIVKTDLVAAEQPTTLAATAQPVATSATSATLAVAPPMPVAPPVSVAPPMPVSPPVSVATQLTPLSGNYLITTPDENMMVEFGYNMVVFDLTTDIPNRVFWKFIPVAGQKNMYNIQNTWRCESNDSRCGYYLSYTGFNIIIAPEKLQWEVTATEKPNIFYIKNGCSEPNSRCQYYLGYSNTDRSTQLTLTSTPYPFKITPQSKWTQPASAPIAKPKCYIDAKSLVRGQTLYTGSGFTYVSESDRNTQSGPGGGTSIWIGDGYTKECIDRAQTVYTGCGYTYATESALNAECGPGGTSQII